MTITIQKITAQNFAPFGQVMAPDMERPDFAGPGYSTWRFALELDGKPDLTLLRHQYQPILLKRMEKHSGITETRLPLDDRSSVIFVAATDGAPDPREVQGFYVPGDTGVIIGRGIWHSSSFPMDARGAQWALISDRETEAELEAAGLGGTPSVLTEACSFDTPLQPDFSGLGRSFDQDRLA